MDNKWKEKLDEFWRDYDGTYASLSTFIESILAEADKEAYERGRREMVEEVLTLLKKMENERLPTPSGDVACWSPVTLLFIISKLESILPHKPKEV